MSGWPKTVPIQAPLPAGARSDTEFFARLEAAGMLFRKRFVSMAAAYEATVRRNQVRAAKEAARREQERRALQEQ